MKIRKTEGQKLIKKMKLTTKRNFSLLGASGFLSVGILFILESFYRLKTLIDSGTWLFFVIVSLVLIFLGLYYAIMSGIYHNKILTKKLLRKNENKKRLKLIQSNQKLEIQKNP